jgi:DnaJ-class molecular chaperone
MCSVYKSINLYTILNVDKKASCDEIKKAYKKQALKYHPDKNKDSDAREMFNKISVAYEILSNEESRNKYNSLNEDQHENLLNLIINFVKSMINQENINKIINVLCENEINIINENNIPNYDIKKKDIEIRLKNKIDLDYINDFMSSLLQDNDKIIKDHDLSIFMSQEELLSEKNYQLMNNDKNHDKSDYSQENLSICKKTNFNLSSDKNTIENNLDDMNIVGEIKTNLNEVYMGMSKEISVKRQIIENNQIIFRQHKYIIPLINDIVKIENQGDEYLDKYGNIMTGKLIINIRCKKHNYFKRVNDYDILVSLPMTMNELFNGFKKNFDYFNDENIQLVMLSGFSKVKSNKKIGLQNKFDGNKITVTIKGYGLFNDINQSNRGDLIIYVVLMKKQNFNLLLKNFD